MTIEEVRGEMEGCRESAAKEARVLRDSYLVLDRLRRFYRQLEDHDRAMSDRVVAEWALSPDENLRFDALTLIREFKIQTATPALSELAARLAAADTPGAPYELRKVRELFETLTRSN